MGRQKIYKNGRAKYVSYSSQPMFPMKKYISSLLGALYMDMATFKRNIEAFNNNAQLGVPFKIQALVSSYCQAIFEFADAYKVQSGRVSRSAKQSVNKLHEDLNKFYDTYSKIKQEIQISDELELIILYLIEAISWFVRQYSILINSWPVTHSVPVSGKKQDWHDFIEAEKLILTGQGACKVLTHRPIDGEMRKVFRTCTSAYQAVHGKDKFIQFKRFMQEVDKLNKQIGSNLKCSERTYHTLKIKWKSGTLDFVV